MKAHRLAMAGLALMVFAGSALADDLQDTVKRLGGKKCEDSDFTCVDITVPVDHDKPNSNATLQIHFAVHFAEEASKGILFYAVGGPGGAGTAVADSYLASFDARLGKELDVVFFDQRGTGQSSPISCDKAGLAFDLQTISLKAPEAAVAASKSFVDACLGEIAHRDLLPYLATDQAVQDVEAFRQAIGAPKVWFYGESYGTQFAQAYATRYPKALRGVILDGVVDLTRDAESYYREDVLTVEKLLANIFEACDRQAKCHEDMGKPAAEVYDDLAGKLAAAPVKLRYPLGSGGTAEREFTTALLEADAFYALYGADSRTQFLRGLAAAGQGNLLPLVRIGYQNIGADAETLEHTEDPTWFGGAYYGITCPDYDDAGHDPRQRAGEILDQARKLAPQAPRLIRDFFAERLVCAFWPAEGAAARPEPFAGGDYPTLVLNSDADPATPVSNGYAVFDHAKNAFMVTMQGGPHVIWGRGLACPDKIVFALMLDGRKPERPEQLCRQDLTDPYVALTDGDTADPFVLARAVATEIEQSPELAAWDGGDQLDVGCDFGGTVTATAAKSGSAYSFEDCALWPGVAISGDAVKIDAGDGDAPDGLTLSIAVAGKHKGELIFRRDSTTEATGISGTWDGQPIKPPRPLP